MAQQPIPDAELSLAKELIVRSLPTRFETSADAAASYADSIHLRPRTRLLERLPEGDRDGERRGRTGDGQASICRRSKMIAVAVGDRAKIQPELEKLNLGRSRSAMRMPMWSRRRRRRTGKGGPLVRSPGCVLLLALAGARRLRIRRPLHVTTLQLGKSLNADKHRRPRSRRGSRRRHGLSLGGHGWRRLRHDWRQAGRTTGTSSTNPRGKCPTRTSPRRNST